MRPQEGHDPQVENHRFSLTHLQMSAMTCTGTPTETSGGPDEVPYMKPYLGNTTDLLLLDGHRPNMYELLCDQWHTFLTASSAS